MRPARAPVFALVALLVIAAMGCPCVWAAAFAPHAKASDASAVKTLHGRDCACCCCERMREQARRDRGPKPSSPKAPAPPCSRRAHGEGVAPETTIDMAPPAAIALAIPLLIPTELPTIALVAVDTHHDEGPPGPRPPDEARRGVVLRN